MSKKITQLDETEQLSNNSVFPVVNEGATKKITFATLKSLLSAIFLTSETDPTVPNWAKAPTKPSYNTSEIVNDSGFITNTVNNLVNYYLKTETYTKTEVNTLIANITKVTIQIVQELPQTGESNVIYFVPKDGSTGDVYNEYIYINNSWELIGTTEIDLTGYATQDWVNTQISNFLTSDEISALITTALTNYYDKDEIDEYITALQTSLSYFQDQYKAMLRSRKYTVGTGESVTLNNTAEGVEFRKPPLPIGNSKQTQLTGKNLFNINGTFQQKSSMNGTPIIDNGILTTPTNLEWSSGSGQFISNINAGDTVTAVAELVGIGTGTNGMLDIIEWNENTITKHNQGQSNVVGDKIIVTTTISNNTTDVAFAFNTLSGKNASFKNIMFLKGNYTSSNIPSYEPYCGGIPSPNPSYPQDINSSGDSGSINTTVGDRNVAKRNTGQYNNYRILQPIPVKAGDTITYIVNFTSTQSGDMLPRLYANEKMSQLLNEWTSIAQNGDRVGTITITADGYFTLAFGYGYTTVTFSKLFVAFGTHTLADYTPHAEQNFNLSCQQPMRRIERSTGIIRDCFFKNVVGSEYYNAELTENAWYERHVIAVSNLGTKNWLPVNNDGASRTQGLFALNSSIEGIKSFTDLWYLPLALSNKYLFSSAYYFLSAGRNPADMRIAQYNSSIYVQNSSFSGYTNEQVKEAMNGTLLYYELSTPTYLPCTSAQVEVLEAICKAKSYYEQTNIYSTDEVSPIYEVEAYQDENLVIDEINQAIVALGGV